MKRELTHMDDDGNARMVDVSDKPVTVRRARARATVRVGDDVARMILETGGVRKGDVLQTARLAGIMGAKKVPELVPMTHGVALDHVDVQARVEGDRVVLESSATCTGRTGVEVEAMTAAAVAALTVYDMCKSARRGIVIEDVLLLEKSGGRSKTWRRKDAEDPG